MSEVISPLLEFQLKSVNDRLGKIESNIDRIAEQNVGRREFLEYKSHVDQELSSLKDTNKWLGRLVIGLVVASAMAYFLRT